MKAATLALFGVALSVALPAASHAQNYGQNNGGGFNLPLPNFGNRQDQQAQGSSDRDHYRYCQDLRQRAEDLRDDQSRARNSDDRARARDRLDDIKDRLARDCRD